MLRAPLRPVLAIAAATAVALLLLALNTALHGDRQPARARELADAFAALAVTQAASTDGAGRLGNYDADVVVKALPLILRRLRIDDPAATWLVVDVGANVGQTMAGFLHALSPLACLLRSERHSHMMTHADCARDARAGGIGGIGNAVKFVSFEPMPQTAAVLRQLAEAEQWKRAGWTMFEMALSDSVGTGTTTFYAVAGFDSAKGYAGEQSSLNAAAVGSKNTTAVTVRVETLDRMLGTGSLVPEDYATRRILLLKVDAEGFDALVLRGAEMLLSARRVKFLVFEYNWKWFTNNRTHTLHDQADHLHRLGYWCFLLADETPRPLFGPWWRPAYEIRKWSNAFCGLAGDTDVLSVLLQLASAKWHPTLLAFWAVATG